MDHETDNCEKITASGLCYMLVCYKSREFVAYLLASLYRDEDTFFVHCDERAPFELKSYVEEVSRHFGNIIRMKATPYSWAGYSHVDVSLQAMAAGVRLTQRWSHFIFLSEQHLPLKSPLEIETYLSVRKSAVQITSSTHMLPEAQADIQNRFGAVYRELPGVGCFATSVVEHEPAFFDNIFHGSNWIALHRDHCEFLLGAERNGAFDIFQTIVHAEEMAIPTILARRRDEIDDADITLVAAPHLVDNRGLQMTEDLFRSALTSRYLFIRKRPKHLSTFVDSSIREKHFCDAVYRMKGSARATSASTVYVDEQRKAGEISSELLGYLESRCKGKIIARIVDPAAHEFSCRVHLVVRLRSLPPKQSVRVLSQDLRNFKVCLVEVANHSEGFPRPREENGILYSTARVKINDLFAYTEILPTDLPGSGFVSLDTGKSLEDVASLVEVLLMEAGRFMTQEHGGIELSQATAAVNVRADRINRLAQLSRSKRYLEIGVAFGETFFDVNVQEKVAVDPEFRFDFKAKATDTASFYPLPSDAFFEAYHDDAFDLIYLDGLHTYDQTSRDFFNSIRLAHEKTIWLLDDTVPNDAFSALPSQAECYHHRAMAGNPDPSWMGDVYKTVLLICRLLPFFDYRTFEGHGQTIVWRRNRAKVPDPASPSLDVIGSYSYEQLTADYSILKFASDEDIYNTIKTELFM